MVANQKELHQTGGIFMTKIYLDAGHGGKDPGACGNGLRECDVTLDVTLEVRDRLKAHGFEVVISREKDEYVGDAGERGAKIGASKADFGLSIHCNAGGGTGAELIMPCRETYGKIEYYIAQEFSKLGKWRKIFSRDYTTGKNYNRTIDAKTFKVAALNLTDYYGIPREAWKKGVSADIIELFFIDTKVDVENYQKQKSVYIEAIVKAICLGFNVEYKQPTPVSQPATNKGVMYRVVCGSYSVKDNANKVKNETIALGYSSFLHAVNKDNKTFYQVICGSYSNKNTAEKVKSELITKGYSAFLQVA